MSFIQVIGHMNKWKLGVIIILLGLVAVAAFGLLHIKASEFPLTEQEKAMALSISEASVPQTLGEHTTVRPKVGWRLQTYEGEKRVTYVTMESSDASLFVAVDLDIEKAVTVVESRDWTKRTSVVPFRFVVNYAEDPQHQFMRTVGIGILTMAVLVSLVWIAKEKV